MTRGGSRIWQGRVSNPSERGTGGQEVWGPPQKIWKSRHSLIHFPGISGHYKLYDWVVCFYDKKGTLSKGRVSGHPGHPFWIHPWWLWPFRRYSDRKHCKLPFWTPHCHLTPHSPRNPYKFPQSLYCEKLESMSYIFAADSMGLSIILQFIVVGPEKQLITKYIMAVQGIKVLRGRWFWHQLKACMPLPVSHQ